VILFKKKPNMNDIEIEKFYLSDNDKRLKVLISIGHRARIYKIFAFHQGAENGRSIFKSKGDKVVGPLVFEMFLEGSEEVVRLRD